MTEQPKQCQYCQYFTLDYQNPAYGLGSCQLNVNRKNKPLYPTQDACESFEETQNGKTEKKA
jgi:hypothetical protein